MGRDVARWALEDLKGSILAWTLGLAAYAALLTASFPSIRGNEAVQDYLETLPEAMLAFFGTADITSAAGFYRAELFSYLPVLLAVFTVSKALALTIDEERAGTMDVVLAQPIPRWRVFVGRFVALAGATFAVLAGLAATLALGGLIVSLSPREVLGLAAWSLLAGLPALVFGATALAATGFAHRRRIPLALGTVAAAGSFLLNGLAPLVDALSTVQDANPYRWYALADPIAGEVPIAGTLGLVVLVLALVAVGAVGFQRRDIDV